MGEYTEAEQIVYKAFAFNVKVRNYVELHKLKVDPLNLDHFVNKLQEVLMSANGESRDVAQAHAKEVAARAKEEAKTAGSPIVSIMGMANAQDATVTISNAE